MSDRKLGAEIGALRSDETVIEQTIVSATSNVDTLCEQVLGSLHYISHNRPNSEAKVIKEAADFIRSQATRIAELETAAKWKPMETAREEIYGKHYETNSKYNRYDERYFVVHDKPQSGCVSIYFIGGQRFRDVQFQLPPLSDGKEHG